MASEFERNANEINYISCAVVPIADGLIDWLMICSFCIHFYSYEFGNVICRCKNKVTHEFDRKNPTGQREKKIYGYCIIFWVVMAPTIARLMLNAIIRMYYWFNWKMLAVCWSGNLYFSHSIRSQKDFNKLDTPHVNDWMNTALLLFSLFGAGCPYLFCSCCYNYKAENSKKKSKTQFRR